jgi:hypothetical protein
LSFAGGFVLLTMFDGMKRKLPWIVGIYLLLWGLTASWGRIAARREVILRVSEFNVGIQDAQRIVPQMRESRVWIQDPWYGPWYNTTVIPLCPFVLVVRYAVMPAPLGGEGGRAIVFWVPGFARMIHRDMGWVT